MHVNKSNIKVLHVIHSLHIGGAENVVSLYALHHTSRNFAVDICVFKAGGHIFNELAELGIRIHCLNTTSSSFSSFIKLLKLLKKEKYSVIHFHNPLPALWGIPAAILAKTPIKVLTEHSIYYKGRLGIAAYYYYFVRKFLNKIVTCSLQVKKSHLPRIGNIPNEVIYNGIDLDVYYPSSKNLELMKNLRIKKESIVLGHIGNLTPQKGQLILLEAMKQVVSAANQTLLLIVGDGPLKNILVSKAGELGIFDKVIFLGQRRDVPQILSLCDIVVGSSLREGFPMSVLEAMATGKPVVTTDVGGNREAIESNISGILVPVGDAKSLSMAVIDLIVNKSKRERIGKEARRRVVEKFSIKKMIEDTENIYYQLIMN